jgi:GNAT superfamily N-acetyltransferase
MSENIRRAAPKDSADIADMIHGLAEFERTPDECTVTETQISTALFGHFPTVHGHVAEVDGEIAAMALWFLSFSTWDGVAGIYVEDLFVRPRFRRRGLARALLAALAEECLDNG